MQTYVMLSRMLPTAAGTSAQFKANAAKVRKMLETEVPQAKWICSYATMGQYDAVDIFEAPDMQHAATVSAIVRVHGQSETQTMLAQDWSKFVAAAGTAKG